MDETRTYKPGDYPPTPEWAIPCKATGPDPSRAEMAMAIYPQCLANYHSSVKDQDCGYFTGWEEVVAEAAVKHADALIAALARKEAK